MKKQKRRHKATFSEIRYPKKSKISGFWLPDEVFWPAYYGMCKSGIVSQYRFYMRWHAVQCLEGGFQGDDERLLEARRILTGLFFIHNGFISQHSVVIESDAFIEKAKSLAVPSSERVKPRCKWKARAALADIEFISHSLRCYEEFYKRMEYPIDSRTYDLKGSDGKRSELALSYFYAHNLNLWMELVSPNTHSKEFSSVYPDWLEDLGAEGAHESVPRDWLEGLDAEEAHELVSEHAQSELTEMQKLSQSSGSEWNKECMHEFLWYLWKQRAAYTEGNQAFERLNWKNGHSNFGLNIDMCFIPSEKSRKRIDSYTKDTKKTR